MKQVTVRVPASTANIGPGFDCLAMALDIWNESIFTLEGDGCTAVITGEGAGKLPRDEKNLTAQAAMRVYAQFNKTAEPGLLLRCYNQIPLNSGLGSSAAAVLAGILGANELLGRPMSSADILELCAAMEGHPDNAAAAQIGGLVMVGKTNERLITRRAWDGYVIGDRLQAAVVLPEIHISTKSARKVIPHKVDLQDAVFNTSMTMLVVHAFQSGDLDLLGDVMADRLHQQFRFPLYPGAEAAIQAARKSGAAASVLSGAGPSVIAIGLEDMHTVADAMAAEFLKVGIQSRKFLTSVIPTGASVIVNEV